MLRRLPLIAALASATATAAPPAAPPGACPVETGVQDVYGEPARLDGIAAGQPVPLRAGAMLAMERVRFATRIWRTAEPLQLPERYHFTYPAGVPVTALRTEGGIRKCLRDAGTYRHGPSGGRFIPCLVDRDGDGRYEIAEMFGRDSVVTTFGRQASFARPVEAPLAAPVTLREDAEGLESGRTFAYRRVRVAEANGGGALLVVEHATQSAYMAEQLAGLVGADGRRGSAAAASRRVAAAQPRYEAWPAPLRIALTDGAVVRFAGIRFRLAATPAGWTATPLDAHFPTWWSFDCEGATLRIGRS